eukprot:SAG11_NODE_7967_length_1076_cov_1.552712_3_plen_95_part_01
MQMLNESENRKERDLRAAFNTFDTDGGGPSALGLVSATSSPRIRKGDLMALPSQGNPLLQLAGQSLCFCACPCISYHCCAVMLSLSLSLSLQVPS